MIPTATAPPQFRTDILKSDGWYGRHGGMFVPDVLHPVMHELAQAFSQAIADASFTDELHYAYRHFSGRPTPLTPLPTLSAQLGLRLFLKNEGLNITGAHKINHCLGQVLLARRLGKKRIIAETGAGQHGYATATVCARYGLPCTIYMGAVDYARQRPNVQWMEMLGAQVVPVHSGQGTLNDAVIAAFQDLVQHPDESHYLLGSAVGPHPYPLMNGWFQKIVSEEMALQCMEHTGQLPHAVVACLGGGSNALGAFWEFMDEPTVRLVAVEAGGTGTAPGQHATKLGLGSAGVFEGYASYFLQDNDGNISPTGSICAGLDYCGVSPLLAHLYDQGRLTALSATDAQTLEALQRLARTEGILLALESAHAVAGAIQLAPDLPTDAVVIINGSGRAEKDLFITAPRLAPQAWRQFLADQLAALSPSPSA